MKEVDSKHTPFVCASIAYSILNHTLVCDNCAVLEISLRNMCIIRTAWEAVELGGIATLRQTKLTIDHFVKNPHSRMQVFLSAQIFSSSIHYLLYQYVAGNEVLTAVFLFDDHHIKIG